MLGFFGVFLSDLSQDPAHQAWCNARKWPSRILSPLLILSGLLLASYPENEPQWMAWSKALQNFSQYIFPRGSENHRFYTGIGLIFVALGIHFSHSAKAFLSSRYLLWFGKQSFAVYLLHGSLLRSVLCWMMFGIHVPGEVLVEGGGIQPGPPLPLCGRFQFWTLLPIWVGIVYACAFYWTKYVDPWCARVTERLVRYVFEDSQQGLDPEKRLLPQ
jgi:peptidoglycan/LPS O-acetylase OafA/YrhL